VKISEMSVAEKVCGFRAFALVQTVLQIQQKNQPIQDSEPTQY
jgi:hypothetical protein